MRNRLDGSGVKAVIGTILSALLLAATSCGTDASPTDQPSAGAGGSASGAAGVAGDATVAGSTGDEPGEGEGVSAQRLVESCTRLCSLNIYARDVAFVDGCEPGQHYRGGVPVGEASAGGAGGAGPTQDPFPIDPGCASDCAALEEPPTCQREIVAMTECMVESDWVCDFADYTSLSIPGCEEIVSRVDECLGG